MIVGGVVRDRGARTYNGASGNMGEQIDEGSGIDDLSEPLWEMTKDNRRRTILAVAVTAIFLLSAVQTIAMNAKAEDQKPFYLGMGESVSSANPFVGMMDADYMFYSFVYDYLNFPDKDGIPTPNLAKSWWHMNGSYAASHGSDFSTLDYHKNSSDWPAGSIWEYNLTEKVFWNDGEPFTADDVVFTINIQTGSGYINFWAFQPWTKWIDCCQKVDDYKVRIFFADHVTHTPVPIVWGDFMSMPIIPKHIFTEVTEAFIAQNWTGIPVIGTGPFMGTPSLASEMLAKESLTLTKNPYWNFTEDGVSKGLGGVYNRTIQIDKLIMKFYAEEQALVVDLRTQKLDTSEVSPSNYFAINADSSKPKGLSLMNFYSSTVYSKISHFNVWKGASASLNPTRLDPAVLRATAVATNKSYIVAAIYKGLATPGVGIYTPVWPQYYWDPPHDENSTFNVTNGAGIVKWSYTKPLDEVMSFNLTLANEILDEAGYVWTDATHTLRKAGPDAADRLVNLGIVGDVSAALNKPLQFEDTYELEVWENKEISEYFTSEWAHIGVKLTQNGVSLGLWSKLLYGFQTLFTETYWSGDIDPNYLMYVTTSYAMDGWNEFGTMDPYYDNLYSKQSGEFNATLRKHYLDKCQEWQYLQGGAMIYIAYPKSTFAFNDALNGSGNWGYWGNWSEHPGLGADYSWGETPLFCQIKWIGGNSGGDIPMTTLIIVGAGIASIIAAGAAIMAMRRRNTRKLLEEEDMPKEESKKEE